MSESAPTNVRRAGLGFVAVLAGLFVFNGIGVVQNCSDLRPVHSGQPAPDFQMRVVGADGRIQGNMALAQTKGAVVILDFWATWCGPCRSTMPMLEKLANKYGDRGLRILSVNTEGTGAAAKARAMVDRLAPSVELMMDTGEGSTLFNVTSIPHMLVIGRDGTISMVHRGLITVSGLRSDLESAIEELL